MPNRLANESSPYLRQHQDNPVDWYPWGAEALERARIDDRPVLVSIGYSACHWCHVMAHESFEDTTTAALMNEHFVNIKIDREERPDIDSLYMTAVQVMTGRGGWPLNVFLTPDGVPFFGGTYWPPSDRQGMPSFRRIIDIVAETWQTKRDEIQAQGDQIRAALATQPVGSGDGPEVDEDTVIKAVARMANQFDAQHGGFGGAPKFPQASMIEFLLRAHHLTKDRQPLQMALTTLERMANGGIFDQIGGGFHRYAVDAIWLVPHFEKMLYDNAQLARAYVDVWRITGTHSFRRTAELTLDYILREMNSEQGAFFAAQDADSEGEEGKFYVWTPEEIRAILNPDDAEFAISAFGVSEDGNFEGKSIPTGPDSSLDPSRIESVRHQVYESRSKRIWPGLDDKIITSWNGMTIRALAEGSRAFDRSDYAAAAVRCAEFLMSRVEVDGVLYRTFGGGSARIPAFLEDYAQLIDGLISLYEATFDLRWLQWATDLTARMVNLFSAEDGIGFYDTSAEHDQLIIRPRDLQDGATPCGSSVAIDVLIRIGHFTGNQAWIDRGINALRTMKNLLEDQPLGFGRYLSATTRFLETVREVAIAPVPEGVGVAELAGAVYARFEPGAFMAMVEPDAIDLIPWLADRPVKSGLSTAYLCEQFVCLPPVTNPDDLKMQLEMGTGMTWRAF